VTGRIDGVHGEVGQLGQELFTRYLFAFEATAGLLVIAVVGAVVLARRPSVPGGDVVPIDQPDGDPDAVDPVAVDPYPAGPTRSDPAPASVSASASADGEDAP
jgi:hypothetical protein